MSAETKKRGRPQKERDTLTLNTEIETALLEAVRGTVREHGYTLRAFVEKALRSQVEREKHK